MVRAVLGFIVIVAAVMVGVSNFDDDNKMDVSAEDFGDKWPLTIESGTLICEPDIRAVLFVSPDGGRYGVNGTGKARATRNIRSIWRDDPDSINPKINIGPLIDAGLALCS